MTWRLERRATEGWGQWSLYIGTLTWHQQSQGQLWLHHRALASRDREGCWLADRDGILFRIQSWKGALLGWHPPLCSQAPLLLGGNRLIQADYLGETAHPALSPVVTLPTEQVASTRLLPPAMQPRHPAPELTSHTVRGPRPHPREQRCLTVPSAPY